MIVNGFANPVSKELPLEYAVEMNNLTSSRWKGRSDNETDHEHRCYHPLSRSMRCRLPHGAG